jgi:hypothetical protein
MICEFGIDALDPIEGVPGDEKMVVAADADVPAGCTRSSLPVRICFRRDYIDPGRCIFTQGERNLSGESLFCVSGS